MISNFIQYIIKYRVHTTYYSELTERKYCRWVWRVWTGIQSKCEECYRHAGYTVWLKPGGLVCRFADLQTTVGGRATLRCVMLHVWDGFALPSE